MKVIVCGAGKVGLSIARYLEQHGDDVIVIDNNQELIKEITETLDVRALYGFASDPEVLYRAGANDADMLIAVTRIDEVNMVACEVAAAVFQIPLKMARVRNQSYLNRKWARLFEGKHLEIDKVISPEIEISKEIVDTLSTPGVTSFYPMLDQKVAIIGMNCTAQSPVINTPLAYITSLFPGVEFHVFALYRNRDLFLPTLDDKILEGDEAYFVCRLEDVEQAAKAFYEPQQSTRRILIVGGGNIGFNLAQMLHENHPYVKVRLIERNSARSHYLSRALPNATIYQGDGLDANLLLEAGIQDVETIVTVTEDDKVNALAALLAKQKGAQRAVALMNKPGSGHFITSLGIDSVVHPRSITVANILRYIKRNNICTHYMIQEEEGELIEVKILQNTRLRGSKIAEVNRAQQIQVIALMRDDEIQFPKDDLILDQGDRLLLIAHRLAIKDLETIFASRSDYF